MREAALERLDDYDVVVCTILNVGNVIMRSICPPRYLQGREWLKVASPVCGWIDVRLFSAIGSISARAPFPSSWPTEPSDSHHSGAHMQKQATTTFP